MFGLFGFVTDAVLGKPGYFEYCKEAYQRERADEAAKEAVGSAAKRDSESGPALPFSNDRLDGGLGPESGDDGPN